MVFRGKEIVNFDDLVKELSLKKECHGAGKLITSYTQINFEKAKVLADKMQEKSPLKYGPFIYDGTNCSRFVRNIISAGNPVLFRKFKIWAQYTLTESPALNVKALSNHKIEISKEEKLKIPEKIRLNTVLKAPELKPDLLAKWFAGEGAGSWYVINRSGKSFVVKRYSPELIIECAKEMTLSSGEKDFNETADYTLAFPSHSKIITLVQNGNQLF